MQSPIRTTFLLGCTFSALTIPALAQQSAPASSDQQDQYQGQSNPPADDVITTLQPDPAKPKPAPGKPLVTPAPAPEATTQYSTPAPAPALPPATEQPAMPMAQQTATAPPAANADENGDNGIVQVAPPEPARPAALMTRNAAPDPDGDIVHPAMLPPGTLEEGTQIHVRLLTELSSGLSQKGDIFRGRVDRDVMQDGIVLIPAGAEITGKVMEASSGHFAGHGTLRLRPETVILPNGSQYMLVARLAGTRNSHTSVDREGTIEAGTRYKRDGVEYGGGVGTGVVAGAVLGGPVGALAGGLVGASLVTVHLMLDHPQATLEPGSTLLFTLSDRLSLVATNANGN